MKKIMALILSFVLSFGLVSAFAEGDTILKNDGSWKMTASSTYGEWTVDKAFDGDDKTYWHSYYESENGRNINIAPLPHVITVDFGKTVFLAGWGYLPRSSNDSGIFESYNLYASENGTDFKKIYSGSFSYEDGRTLKTAAFSETAMRTIKIEVTSAGYGYGVASEIKFYEIAPAVTAGSSQIQTPVKKAPVTEDGKNSKGIAYLDRTGWVGEGKSQGAATPQRALDGNTTTHWHSYFEAEDGKAVYRDEPPFEIEFILPEATLTSGISLHPWQDMANGWILLTDVYAKSDVDGEYVKLYEDLAFDKTKEEKEVSFNTNLSVKIIKFIIKEGSNSYGTLGEFNLWEPVDTYKTTELSDFMALDAGNRLYKIDNGDFKATSEEEEWEGHGAEKVVDGTSGFWQTQGERQFPIILDVDLGKVHAVKEIVYTPRQSADLHGCWRKVSIYYSEDGNEWNDFARDVSLEASVTKKTFSLPEEAEARYFMFEIREAGFGRASCQEIEFYQSKSAREREYVDKSEKYVLTIDSNVIKSEKGRVLSEKTIDVAPYIIDGSTMIPLRGLVEEMGAEILWDDAKKKITLKTTSSEIVLQIWNKRVYVKDSKLGDVMYTLKNFPVIQDSRTFIPVRFVSEQLGYNVAWDGEAGTVTITK